MNDFVDLLGRPPATADEAAIGALLCGAAVLITGAGGSIGAGLCRQVHRFRPARLILVDRAEDNLFRIATELPAGEPFIGDVCDRNRMEALFARCRPDIVFHAAAYKHVPLMQDNAAEAVRNNVLGTRTVADTAALFGARAFVLLSSDKAVLPTSVMGATKRLAERYIRALHARSRTTFAVVRFGNVLGSTGSVVPTFLEQIERGGPVTVTHPEMERYFMTIPEACLLSLQAAAMAKGGEVFVLDMGKPLRIVDLARTLIRRCGRAIEITYIGIRPGEKLQEDLSREGLHPTAHPGVLVSFPPGERLDEVITALGEIRSASDVKAKLLEVA
jgi:FlaA1/EpsC-like NDP-sugar epimerase